MTPTIHYIVEPAGTPTTSIARQGAGLLMARPERNEVWRWDAESDALELYRKFTGAVRGIAVSQEGRIYACQTPSRRIIEYLADGTARTLSTQLDGQYHNFPVSLAVDDDGRIWFADAKVDVKAPGPDVYPRLDHASVLRLDPGSGGSWQMYRMTTDTNNPLAVAVSVDGLTLFVADLANESLNIYAYDVDSAHSMGERRRVLGLPGQSGLPGMSITNDGNLLLAGVGASHELRLIDPDGNELEIVVLDEEPTHAIPSGSDDSTAFVATRSGAILRIELDSMP
jgi:gluconolactonase